MTGSLDVINFSSQGEDTTKEREITGTISLVAAAEVLRAFGFYATQFEVREICHEIMFEKGASDPKKTFVAFEELAKGFRHNVFFPELAVYVNHRPVFAIDKSHIEDAFQRLGADSGGIETAALMKTLSRIGEPLSSVEMSRCLSSLLATERPEETLPHEMTASEFAENILGFQAN